MKEATARPVEPSLEQRVSVLENLVFVLRAELAAERAQQAPCPGAEPEWLSVARTAQLAHVSKAAIYKAEREGRLEAMRRGRHLLIDAKSAERYAKRG